MKRIYLLSLLLGLLFISGAEHSYGFSIVKPSMGMVKDQTLNTFKAIDFVKLSAKQLSKLTGKRMNWWDRLTFKLVKIKMKHDLKKSPGLRVTDYYSFQKKSPAIRIIYSVILGFLLLLLILFFALKHTK